MTSIQIHQPRTGFADRVRQMLAVGAGQVAAVWNAAVDRRAGGNVRSAVVAQLFDEPAIRRAAAPVRPRLAARGETRAAAISRRYRDLEI